jgi:hypothetical protein
MTAKRTRKTTIPLPGEDGAVQIVETWRTSSGSRVFDFYPTWGRGALRVGAGEKLWGELVLRDDGYALKIRDDSNGSTAVLDPRTM